MPKHPPQYRLLLISLMLLILPGCLLSAETANDPGIPQAAALRTATPVPSPFPTFDPQQVQEVTVEVTYEVTVEIPVTAVVTQLVESTELVVVTATTDPNTAPLLAEVTPETTVELALVTNTPAEVALLPPTDTMTPQAEIPLETPTSTPQAVIPLETPTATPTSTATTTATSTEIPSVTPQAVIPLETPTATATLVDFAAQSAPESEIPLETPTATPTLTPTLEEIISGLILPTDTPEGVAVAQEATPEGQASQLDPSFQTATAIVEAATQTVIAETRAAEPPTLVPEQPTATVDTSQDLSVPPSATPGAAAPQQPVPTGSDCIHEVSAGQNLYRLSLLYGVPILDIANASGVGNPNFIVVGQKLTIPGCGTTGATPPPTSTPTATFGPGGTFGGTPNASGGTFNSAGGIQHTVAQGETLWQISQRYGVPIATIAQANGIANPDLIDFNDVLTIP